MNPFEMLRRWAIRIPGVIATRLPSTSTRPPWATAVSHFRVSAVLGDLRFLTRVCKQVSNLNKTGSCVEALAVELEAGRADALAVAPPVELDAAGVGAPGVEARAPALDTTRIAFAFAFAFGLAFAFGFLAAARALRVRALPNCHFLARSAIATLVFFASTASAPPKFLVRGPDARPDQQSVAAFAVRFFTVSARKRKVFSPTSGAGIFANDATN